MRCLTVSAALMLAGLLPAYGAGQTLPRGFELVQVTQEPADNYFPRINRHSQIVFTHRPVGGGRPGQEVFLYDGRTGDLTQITDNGVNDVVPDISDTGVICWSSAIGAVDPNTGEPTLEIMVRDPDGTITRLTDNATHDISPKVNIHGVIAWSRDVGLECGLTSDIWMYDGQIVRPVTTDALRDRISHQVVELNDLNELVWNRIDFCNPPPGFNFASKVMMYSNDTIRALTEDQLTPLLPHINNFSQVVWENYDPDLELDVVELWENGVTTPLIVDGNNPAINDRADVSFNRWDAIGGKWDMWLMRDGAFHQLTNDPINNVVSSINAIGEVTWGTGSFDDVRYLRRFDLGDLNCDGAIDAFDIEPLLWILFEPAFYDTRLPECDPLLADMNADGRVDAFDIEPFLAVLFP